MFGAMFRNLPPVSKNLLIINLLFYLAKVLFDARGIYLHDYLAVHNIASPLFQPYQLVTSMFMHGDIMHLLFNMLGVVMMGAHLERYWGSKRYLTFYFITGIGATICSLAIKSYQVYQLTGAVFPDADLTVATTSLQGGLFEFSRFVNDPGSLNLTQLDVLSGMYVSPELGASGALYGVLMAFAMLFPNTEFMLLFPPIPIKAKWMALILGCVALYSGIAGTADGYAHFAHLGGMLFGFIMIKIWQRDKTNFY
jgi:membrane associated rhomboid family serine protease